jgi:hypothetical protein
MIYLLILADVTKPTLMFWMDDLDDAIFKLMQADYNVPHIYEINAALEIYEVDPRTYERTPVKLGREQLIPF